MADDAMLICPALIETVTALRGRLSESTIRSRTPVDRQRQCSPSREHRDAGSVPDQFPKDIIRMIATLFAPMLVGAFVIPLLMLLFSLLAYLY
jgi:hypothetical protein